MNKVFFLFLILISISTANEYQKWLESQSQQYNIYKKDMDKEFSDLLKKDWKMFKSIQQPSTYSKPKPQNIPIIRNPSNNTTKEINNSPIVIVKPIKKLPLKYTTIKKEKNIKNFITKDFLFYSIEISIQYDKKTNFTPKEINKNTISNFWDMMSKTQWKKLITQIESYTNNLGLNDWAKYQFIYSLGLNIFEDNSNNANLFTWYILTKMQYDTKVGYYLNKIYLLSTLKHNLYQVSFFTLNKKRYYVLSNNGKIQNINDLYTYQMQYPQTNKSISLEINKEMHFFNNIKNKILSFKFDKKEYLIKTQYSSDLIDFYKTFPQSDYKIYFNSKTSSLFSNSILEELSQIIHGKSEIDAINLLLCFVQTTFKYKTDHHHFGSEKVMFPEETIDYPYSDCEDRSILFSYLIKNLLDIDVIGIKYKNHIATAIALSSKLNGENFKYKGKRYTIADPTYINANIGISMPQYKNQEFEVISLK